MRCVPWVAQPPSLPRLPLLSSPFAAALAPSRDPSMSEHVTEPWVTTLISGRLVRAFLLLKERQTVTETDNSFQRRGRERGEKEGENARAQDVKTTFRFSWECQCSHLGLWQGSSFLTVLTIALLYDPKAVLLGI